MKCINCKAIISDTDKYCPRCGTLFDNGDVEKYGDTLDNYLLNIYLNKKRLNSNISLGYLIFNFFYALYKKMYFEGIIGAFGTGIFIFYIFHFKHYLISSMGFNGLLIFFCILLGFAINVYYVLKFDELYVIRSKGYINKLLREYGSDDLEFLKDKCEKDSKGNLLVPLLIIVGFAIFFLSLIFKNVAFLSFCGII